MTKSMLAATLLMVFILGIHAEQKSAAADKSATADKSGSTARSASVREMMSGVSEIGAILEDRHVVYEAETLKSNVLNAVIEAIDPEGGAILTKDQAAQRQDEEKGLFYGIGCKLRIKDKWPQIMEVASNSAAATAGLCATNLIVKIGDHSTEGMPMDAAVQLLRGGKGEALELTIRADEKTVETRVVKLTRSAIQTPVTGTTETWPQGIGYLKINGLYTNSGAVIVEQLNAWRSTNCFGAILDIRGADGMDLESVVEIGSLFAHAGDTLFTLRDGHHTAVATYQAKAGEPMDKPIMVLIDQDTSGAAEVLAGLLSVCKGAMLIGTPTCGDDRIRNIIPLSDDLVLYMATQRIELGKGPTYYQKGVIPHVRVAPTNTAVIRDSDFTYEEPDIFSGISEQERQDRALIKRIDGDVILRRAVDILLGLKALDFKVR
ncbi:MAG: S41 family peptidase [Kiritimatiellaeota bacterium]|nr:S41 family peptidase [Kiritimatiellota bacterium]